MSALEKRVLEKNMIQERAARKGSDPLTQTARGKLQNQRQKLNDKINKELRMRTGAENLFRAAENNRKLRERVELELSFFNSNIQLLKEQLSEMNSSVEVYQHENCSNFTPMIPLGFKETTPINFANALKDMILEHYSEDPAKYAKELKELIDLREAVRTPQRSPAGVDLLMEYFNQLSYVEKRFFSSRSSHLTVVFHWYDSLTGFPHSQKSISFEKGSVLFNIGSLYTQIACKQDRRQKEGIMQAIVHFEKAAGVFSYLNNRFSSAPSQDMKAETLAMLVSLMLAQAQECVLEGRLIIGPKDGIVACTQIAQEAAAVSKKYKLTHEKMASEPTRSYLPFSWLSMAETKFHFYRGLSHYYVALALMEQKDSMDKDKLKKMFEVIHDKNDDENENTTNGLPTTQKESQILGKAYLREAVVNHEESLRIHNLCKQLRKIDTFRDILQKMHERSLAMFSALEEEDDFSDVPLVPSIVPGTGHDSSPVQTDLSKVKVVDIFWKMGPISVFNASLDWTAPRKVILERKQTEGFGFSVRGDSPVIIADLEKDSVADRSGLKVKDYIVSVGSVDTKCSTHDEVVQLVREASLTLTLLLITPLPKPDKQAMRPFSSLNLPSSPVKQSTGAVSERERKTASRITAPWMFIRRNSGKENGTSKSPGSPFGNGTTKIVSNGRIKSVEGGGDVEL